MAEQDIITQTLREEYDGEIQSIDPSGDMLTIILNNEKIAEIIKYLYIHPETKLQYLTTLCGVHYPDTGQIAVVYQLHNLVTNVRVRLKTFLPVSNPVTQTITDTFLAANWMERETYDFYGVIFQGHPNLKRILNVDDMIIFPLRKEYPLEDQTREDKQDSMFGR